MGQRETVDLHVALRCDSSAPRLARDALRHLRGVAAVRDDALLIVSELVTNAVLHSGCDPHGTITLDAVVCDDALLIAVHDPGRSQLTPAVGVGQPGENGGFGLRLVDQLARCWGMEQPGGRRVWAELALADDQAATSSAFCA